MAIAEAANQGLEVLAQPAWLLAVSALCVPVTVVVLLRVRRWWNSGEPLPLPLDRAFPLVRWSPLAGFILFAFMYLLMYAITWFWEAAVHVFELGPGRLHDPFSPGVFLAQTVPPLAGLAILAMFGRGSLAVVGIRRGDVKAGLAHGAAAFAAVFPLCVAALVLCSILLVRLGLSPQQPALLHTVETAHKAHQVWALVLAILQAGALAPLAEELAYRGVLLVSLLRAIGPGGAIFGSSVLFALAHVGAQPQAVVPLFLLAVALAYVAYRTRSLIGPILAHAAFNTVMVVGTYFGGA